MYYSAYHWHPIVNGGGGFFPSGWNDQIIAVQSYPSTVALAALHRVHVRYLLIHGDFQRIALVRRMVGLAGGYSAALGGRILHVGPDIVIELGSP